MGKHPPTDPAWTSSSLQSALTSDAKPASLLHDEHNYQFIRVLGEVLERRTLDDLEVRRLYLIAIKSRSCAVIDWLRSSSERRGTKAYQELADLMRATEWKSDELFIQVFDWIALHHLSSGDCVALGAYLLSWPDAFFLKLFAGEVPLEGGRVWRDYLWMKIFIEENQEVRLASLLAQISVLKRDSLDAGLKDSDALLFRQVADFAGTYYRERGCLRDAFETYRRLREKHRESYADEMRETCLKILDSNDGDTQLAEAAEHLIPIAGKDSIPPVLKWCRRPYITGIGPITGAPGGGRGNVLCFATAHIGPDSLPLLEAALAKGDVELDLQCLNCWSQYEHLESEEFVADRLGTIIADQELDEELRLKAIDIGAAWKVFHLENVLLECLHDAKRPIREAAVRALGREGGKHLPLALEMLRSRKAPVRSLAVLLLELTATRGIWEDLTRACRDEKNSGIAEEMLVLMNTLSAGLSVSLDRGLVEQPVSKAPKPLISRYKFAKVPELLRLDGTRISELELHYLLLCQWRSGHNAIAPEAESVLKGLDVQRADELALHFVGEQPPYLNLPLWLKPLIAKLCGPQALETSFLKHSQDFWRRRVSDALATVRILNTEGSERAKELLAGYQKYYPWFSKLPWPGLDQGDLFESTYRTSPKVVRGSAG